MINDLLKKIKEAIYGEEVRSSIHDAIEQCYKDATGHPESVAATVKEIGEVSANLSKETADRKAEVNTERKRIDNLIEEFPATAGEYQQSRLVLHSYGNTVVECGTVAEKYTTVPAFVTDAGGPLSSLYTKKTDYQIAVNKNGLYLFALRIYVNSVTANKRIEFNPFVNDVRYAALGSSYNTAGDFGITQITTIPLWLEAGDTVDFRVTPMDAATVKLQIIDAVLYAIDWDEKIQIPDYAGYVAETKDIRVGADGTVYGTAGEAVRSQTSGTPKNLIPTSTKEFEVLGITVKVKGHEFSLSGTATDNGTIRLINETTDTLKMKTGKTYYAYGFPSGTRVTFLSGENVCGTMVLADTDNTFEMPEKADRLRLEVIVKYKDILNYINTLKICDREYKTYQEQINDISTKVNALQEIVTKLATAPQLIATENGGLQIKYSNSEEG